jgi:opacity protein-like surface antigen
MRRFILILGLVAIASQARASDYDIPVLRGSSPDVPTPYVPAPPVYVGWAGSYAGVQAGFSRAGVDFSSSLTPLISDILRDTTIEPNVLGFHVLGLTDDTGSYNVGGFVGFNTQWDDAVLGFELNYGHTNLTKAASDTESRSFINNGQAPPSHTYQYNISVTGSTSVQITDLWTGRFRAGWVVDGFMPYAFVGGAMALTNVFQSVTITGTLTDIVTNNQTTTLLDLPGTATAGQGNHLVYGYTGGLGADYMLTPAIFVRGEWEYIGFRDVKSAKININTFRSALAVRF